MSKYENDLVFSMDKAKKALAKVGVFEIEDYREGTSWYGKWPGYVRPKIDFPITQLELESVS